MHTDDRMRARFWAPAAAVIFAGAVVSLKAAVAPETRIVAVAGSKEKTIESLSVQVNALEMRIKKLEAGLKDVQRKVDKPDSPDDDGSDKSDSKGGDGKNANGDGKGANGGGKNGNGGGQGANDSGSAAGNQSGSAAAQGDSSGALKNVAPNSANSASRSSKGATLPMTVRAPFVVVDSKGMPIFRVLDQFAGADGERGVYIYDKTGWAKISITTVGDGGRMFFGTKGNSYSLSLGAVDDGAGMKVRKGFALRAFAGLDTRGRGLLNVYGEGDDNPVAGVQTTDDGTGLVAVFNSKKPVAFLTQSGAHPGGGNLTVADPAGNGVFSAGYDGEGGAACVDHKQSMHCLGIGLPLGGGQ